MSQILKLGQDGFGRGIWGHSRVWVLTTLYVELLHAEKRAQKLGHNVALADKDTNIPVFTYKGI